MSAGELISVDQGKVVIALRGLQLGLQRREELMRTIGASMLVSVRHTFREQGSPSGSWVPLAASTIKRDPKKYGAGHKLLIDRGVLLNSITFRAFTGGVVIGTNLVYAAVQNFGSRDRTGGPTGPQARIAGRGVDVGTHQRTREIHYERVAVTRTDGKKFLVPRAMLSGRHEVVDSAGRKRTVSGRFEGPKAQVGVKAHRRFQNIPARPFLVFRPEDPQRIRSLVVQFASKAKANAGLAGA